MNKGFLAVLGGLAALAGLALYKSRVPQTQVPTVPQAGPDVIGAAKAQALAPPHPPATPAAPAANQLTGLLGGLLGLLGGHSTASATSAPTAAQGAPQGQTQGAQRVYPIGTSTAPTAGVANLLNVVALGEANNGYNTVYAGSPIAPPQPLTSMTVAQVRAFQDQMIAAGSPSNAVGRYQFIGSTLQGLVDQGVIAPGDLFNKATQDKAATALLNRRGLQQYQAGQIDAQTFANNLAHEWASLPLVSGPNQGRSAYAGTAGNAARVSVPTLMKAIQTA